MLLWSLEEKKTFQPAKSFFSHIQTYCCGPTAFGWGLGWLNAPWLCAWWCSHTWDGHGNIRKKLYMRDINKFEIDAVMAVTDTANEWHVLSQVRSWFGKHQAHMLRMDGGFKVLQDICCEHELMKSFPELLDFVSSESLCNAQQWNKNGNKSLCFKVFILFPFVDVFHPPSSTQGFWCRSSPSGRTLGQSSVSILLECHQQRQKTGWKRLGKPNAAAIFDVLNTDWLLF